MLPVLLPVRVQTSLASLTYRAGPGCGYLIEAIPRDLRLDFISGLGQSSGTCTATKTAIGRLPVGSTIHRSR